MKAEKINPDCGGMQESDRADIEQLLQSKQTIQIKPQGFSMYPMLVPGRDEAVIKPSETEKLKRGDVVLYRRAGSILVLHRIYKVKEEGFYMVGDNQAEIEGPLLAGQIKGELIGFIRKGRYISVKNPIYCFASHAWLWLLPVRNPLKRTAAALRRRLMKKR